MYKYFYKNKEKEDYNTNSNKPKRCRIEKLVEGEETTKYGEFVTSYFLWLTPDEQKNKAEELNSMTKTDDTILK